MLQDYMENYFDVSLGNINKIDPVSIVEEKPDALIIGDIIGDIAPSLEIRNWLVNFSKISEKNKFHLKGMSAFCIGSVNENIELHWREFLQNLLNINDKNFILLHLKLIKSNFALENGATELIKRFSIDFMNYFIE